MKLTPHFLLGFSLLAGTMRVAEGASEKISWLAKPPLDPTRSTLHTDYINRDRVYDFYTKQANHYRPLAFREDEVLPEFPGLDGAEFGHWGNQDDDVWKDARWANSDLGWRFAGVLRGGSITLPRAVCVRLTPADTPASETVAVSFNPSTVSYDLLWKGGFIKLTEARAGFIDGPVPDGEVIWATRGGKPTLPLTYHGYYVHEGQIIFAYRLGEQEWLDSPRWQDGAFHRVLEKRGAGSLSDKLNGGRAEWPEEVVVSGQVGQAREGDEWVIDSITLPTENPWGALFYLSGHDFLPTGEIAVCTITGEVWIAQGIDHDLQTVKWRRFATGLHQPLGLRVVEGKIYVLGRDQITRLHDQNGDGEADFYECFSSAYETSPAAHDYLTGLETDQEGRFYLASANQGICRVSADGKTNEVLATGFRNPNGLAVETATGQVITSSQEGEWVPASCLFAIKAGAYYGYGGPKKDKPLSNPLVYMPRGVDNSSGGQVFVERDDFGLPKHSLIGLSFGFGSAYTILIEEVEGEKQGMIVPLPWEFRSGAHRARFSPHDGQLYVTGLGGWGSYAPDDGCLQRVRSTGVVAQRPVGFRSHKNGVSLVFAAPLEPAITNDASAHFAQVWNYRYSEAYGSPELSLRSPDRPGHDRLEITRTHLSADQRTLFLEIPQLQPAHQLHVQVKISAQQTQDYYATLHRLGPAFTEFAGYIQIEKKRLTNDGGIISSPPEAMVNPYRDGPSGRAITLRAAQGLLFDTTKLKVTAGERLSLTFENPDVVPHNFVLLPEGTLKTAGELMMKYISDVKAVSRHYIPESVVPLAYTDMLAPGQSMTIHFTAPEKKGEYPFLCSFPGHWQLMNGVMLVE